jgi:hypothetical protein
MKGEGMAHSLDGPPNISGQTELFAKRNIKQTINAVEINLMCKLIDTFAKDYRKWMMCAC